MQHIPEVGDFASVKPRFGRVIAVLRFAADNVFRLPLRGGDELGRVGKMVLPIGIYLQHMGVATDGGVLQPCFHRRAFAAVARAEENVYAIAAQTLQQGAAVWARAVVHNQHV